MKVTFDIQSRLPEGMGREVAHADIAAIIGSEIRTVLERVEFEDVTYDDIEPALIAQLDNELVTGLQVTFTELRR